MKFNINAEIKLDSQLQPEKLMQVLEPENKTPDQTAITTTVQHQQVVTEITGSMSVGTLLRSIDDILATVILAQNVAGTTD